jgi:hypothetical protein
MIQYLPEMRQSIRNLQNQLEQLVSSIEFDSGKAGEAGDV